MTLDVPYFKQERGHTCGPASVRMLFRFFGMQVLPEEELALRLKTNTTIGTPHQSIIDEMTGCGLYCLTKKNNTLEEVLYHIDHHKLPVLVNYIEPAGDEGHFALVIGHEHDMLILNDPWNGPKFTLAKNDFVERRHDEPGKFPRWMLVASKERLEPGEQHHDQ